MKPISTVPRALDTIDVATGEPAKAINQRSDVCAVPAAGVVAEAMVALVLADAVTREVRRRLGRRDPPQPRRYLAHLVVTVTPLRRARRPSRCRQDHGRQLVADRRGVEFRDTDQDVEAAAGRSVDQDIFVERRGGRVPTAGGSGDPGRSPRPRGRAGARWRGGDRPTDPSAACRAPRRLPRCRAARRCRSDRPEPRPAVAARQPARAAEDHARRAATALPEGRAASRRDRSPGCRDGRRPRGGSCCDDRDPGRRAVTLRRGGRSRGDGPRSCARVPMRPQSWWSAIRR